MIPTLLISFCVISLSNCSMEMSHLRTKDRVYEYIDLKFSRYITVIFEIPETRFEEFAYIQFWLSDGNGRTSEIGIAKFKEDSNWSQLVFNTDDNYSSGWFNNNLIQWDKPMSQKRNFSENMSLELKKGDQVRMTIEINNRILSMWFNSNFVGMVLINHEHSRRTIRFGLEQGSDSNYKGFKLIKSYSWS